MWAVLDRAARGWRGVVMTPAGVRLLQDLRRQLSYPDNPSRRWPTRPSPQPGLVVVTLAHNLLPWVVTIGLGATGLMVAKILRRRLLALPGRLTRAARRHLLHLPRDWPWAGQVLAALAWLRALPPPATPTSRSPAG